MRYKCLCIHGQEAGDEEQSMAEKGEGPKAQVYMEGGVGLPKVPHEQK